MKIFYGRLTPCLFAVLCSSSLSMAANLARTCVTDTLANYQQLTGEAQCSVGILNFYDFEFLSVATGGATLLSTSQILLTPLVPDGNSGLSGGFVVSAKNATSNTPIQFSVGVGQTATYVIDWHFDIDSGPTATGAALGMDPPFGAVSITQDYCNDMQLQPALSSTSGLPGASYCQAIYRGPFSANSPEQTNLNAQSLHVTTIPDHLSEQISFDPVALNFANVRTTIFIDGTNQISGFDALIGSSTIVDTSVVTPEPGSLLLGFGGVLAVVGLRRGFRQA